MNDNLVPLNADLKHPDMGKILAAAPAYTRLWQENTVGFLSLLHESMERHSKGIKQHVDGFSANASALRVTVDAQGLAKLIVRLESTDDPEEKEFYVNALNTSARDAGNKLETLLKGVVDGARSIGSLPVYDASREINDYKAALEKATIEVQAYAARLNSKQHDLRELEGAIEAFESNGLDSLFEGKLPTVDQVKELVSNGATPAAALGAIEKVLEVVGKLADGVQKGMHYSQLQDQRREWAEQIKQLGDEQREATQRTTQVQGYLSALDEYLLLGEIRQQWLDENRKIGLQLDGVRTQLLALKLTDIEGAHALNKLLVTLRDYAQFVVAEIQKSF